MIRKTLNLTALTALAAPLGINAGASASSLVINSVTALAGPLNLNPDDASVGISFAKYAPSSGTPVIVYWGQEIGADSPIWKEKSAWVCNKMSFQTGYYPNIPGFPPPAADISEVNVDGGSDGVDNYATIDYSTYKLDIDEDHLEFKVNRHAEHDAQLVCDCIYKQGMLRGLGPVGNGNYGGAFTHHELFSDAHFKDSNASWSFTNLLRHPDDAALVARTQSLKIDATNYREDSPTTLFKLLPLGGLGQINNQFQSIEGRAELEARTDLVRPGNFHHLICTNGIEAAKQYVVALRDKVKELCDSYVPPGEEDPVQLCYPAYVLSSLEAFSTSAAFHQHGYINKDTVMPYHTPRWMPPDPPGDPGWYLLGALWHVMGSYDSPNATWTTKIFESGDNYACTESYKTAIEGDPELLSYSRYCPSVVDPIVPSDLESVHFGRITYHAADYALYKALNEPWKEEFPKTEFSNYEMVIVKSDATEEDWYRRPSTSGTRSIQKILRQDNQAPSFYGGYDPEDTYTKAILDAEPEGVAAAVEAWNEYYYPLIVSQILNVIDENRPIDAYVYGVYTPEQLRCGNTNPQYNWGGDKAFFKKMIKTLWLRKIYKYIIFSGDPELTLEAWNEVRAEIHHGDLEI